MARRCTALPLAVALAAAAAAPAQGAATDQLTSTWANVNVCNPGELGARAQLAGDGSDDAMRVRFTAQWLGPDGWAPLGGQDRLADHGHLHRRRLAEQPRVVRDHAVHAERLERADPRRLVHRPHVELAAGRVNRADEAGAHEGLVGHDRLAP